MCTAVSLTIRKGWVSGTIHCYHPLVAWYWFAPVSHLGEELAFSRIPPLPTACLQKLKSSKLSGLRGNPENFQIARWPKFLNFQFSDFQFSGYPNFRFSRCLIFSISRFPIFQIPKFLVFLFYGFWLSRFKKFQISNFVHFWISKFLVFQFVFPAHMQKIRMLENQNVWIFRISDFLDSGIPGFLDFQLFFHFLDFWNFCISDFPDSKFLFFCIPPPCKSPNVWNFPSLGAIQKFSRFLDSLYATVRKLEIFWISGPTTTCKKSERWKFLARRKLHTADVRWKRLIFYLIVWFVTKVHILKLFRCRNLKHKPMALRSFNEISDLSLCCQVDTGMAFFRITTFLLHLCT